MEYCTVLCCTVHKLSSEHQDGFYFNILPDHKMIIFFMFI